ncbi:MAG: NADH-quinone oxidoreductase subunit M [Planctomycetes bacterium]|nr:NADH-quinone oxidoreductase subunit M [Planctomycetota bacterium]
MHDLLLALLILGPLAVAIVLALLPKLAPEPARIVTLLATIVTFCASLPLLSTDLGGGMTHELDLPWIATFGIRFHLGVDGISAPLVVLTTLLMPLVVLASYGHVHDRVKQYCVLLLAMEAGMIGVFAALDLVLFYVFFEMSLVPLYLLIGVFGGARRAYAALKFFLFTVAGSLPLLLAILWLVQKGGSADFAALRTLARTLTPHEQGWLFAAFAAAFCVKVPLVPLHTWLPDAHVEAPTGGSVILAGVTLKMGTYGLLRFCLPLFPQATTQAVPLLLALAVIGILYGALLAWAQGDLKKIIAYSSVSHLGFVVLGLFSLQSTAASGAVLQMINHGLSTGALFLLIGMIYERAHTRQLIEFGGLARTMPRFAFCLVLATLSSIGVPGLNGFIGEFLILIGTWQTHPVAASLAALGVLLGAIYMLGLVKGLLFGPLVHPKSATWRDLNSRELLLLTPLFVLMVAIGFAPQPLLRRIEPPVERMLEAPRLLLETPPPPPPRDAEIPR